MMASSRVIRRNRARFRSKSRTWRTRRNRSSDRNFQHERRRFEPISRPCVRRKKTLDPIVRRYANNPADATCGAPLYHRSLEGHRRSNRSAIGPGAPKLSPRGAERNRGLGNLAQELSRQFAVRVDILAMDLAAARTLARDLQGA